VKVPDNLLAAELLRRLIPISRTSDPRLRVFPHDFAPPQPLAEIGTAAVELQKLGYARFHLEDDSYWLFPTPDLWHAFD
jgi:hypothetical protein